MDYIDRRPLGAQLLSSRARMSMNGHTCDRCRKHIWSGDFYLYTVFAVVKKGRKTVHIERTHHFPECWFDPYPWEKYESEPVFEEVIDELARAA